MPGAALLLPLCSCTRAGTALQEMEVAETPLSVRWALVSACCRTMQCARVDTRSWGGPAEVAAVS